MHNSKMFSLPRILKGLRALTIGPRHLRRRTIHEVVRIVANLAGGHYVGEDFKLWTKDIEFKTKFKQLSPHNLFSMDRKYVLKEFTRSTNNQSGAIAECGSYTGASAWYMANEAKDVDIYLFDSFEGLSQPDIFDKTNNNMPEWEAGDLKTSEEILRKNLAQFHHIHVLKGWIPERFSEVANLTFRLVHIDVDLYQPTLDSLLFFYPRLNQGGVIIMDDYGFENCPGAHRAAEEFMKDKPETIIHLPTGQGIIIRACPH